MFKVKNLILATLVSATLVACGGGGSDVSAPAFATIATSNVTANVTAATSAAVVNQPFTFAAGLPAEFGTTTATDVAFTSTDAAPTFSISSNGATATGTTAFGSCIFTVLSSTFPVGSKLAVGQTVRVEPCQLKIATAGATAGGSASNREVKFALGSVSSIGKNFSVLVNADGSVVLGNITIGTVTIGVVTGS